MVPGPRCAANRSPPRRTTPGKRKRHPNGWRFDVPGCARTLLLLDLGVFDVLLLVLLDDLARHNGVGLAGALVVLLGLALVADVVGDRLVAVLDDEGVAAGFGFAELALGANQLAFELGDLLVILLVFRSHGHLRNADRGE